MSGGIQAARDTGFPDVPAVDGIVLRTAAAGVRYRGRDDIMVAEVAAGSSVAGVVTRSSTRSASVIDCAEKLPCHGGGGDRRPTVFFACSGNANAFTGAHGRRCVNEVAGVLAQRYGTGPENVLTTFTGVIGERFPVEKAVRTIDSMPVSGTAATLEAAAAAIMTTDTFPKGACQRIAVDGADVRIAGIVKGSGMIEPDMATLLAFVFTDARISREHLQELVEAANAATFNCITVDGDTSTSDTLLVAATGRSGVRVDRADRAACDAFAEALESVMRDLAKQVVRDGEGASKFVEVAVEGAVSVQAARTVAKAIANSPLVKTAVAGEDPNWGRIVMAVGKSGVSVDAERLAVRIGDDLVAERGGVAASYSEASVAEHMRGRDIRIAVDLGAGRAGATVWTCDLTRDYIAINADYRS